MVARHGLYHSTPGIWMARYKHALRYCATPRYASRRHSTGIRIASLYV